MPVFSGGERLFLLDDMALDVVMVFCSFPSF
jgi:hypothetical protein